MEKVVCIRVITTTDDYPNAETDDLVKVHILDRDKFILDAISLDKPNYNDRELGQTDEHIKLLDGFMNLDTIRWFRIQIYGNNAWKPRAIMIKLELLSNKTIIACHYAPLFYWLSTDRRDANGRAEPAWDLPIM